MMKTHFFDVTCCEISMQRDEEMKVMRSSVVAAMFAALTACSGSVDVRDGPQAVHPSPSALAQGTASRAVSTPVASAPDGQSETKSLFDAYCTDGMNNNSRVTAVTASGRFGKPQFGKLPVAGFEDLVFVFYKLNSGSAQIGFGSRRGTEDYCVAVDGTATGKEYYITGPT
jgi:hypothetical protein